MRIFVDANILLDIYDSTRKTHQYSLETYQFAVKNKFQLFTSCDLISTIYYFNAKVNKTQAMLNIQDINKTLKIIEFSNLEVEQTCQLMLQDEAYQDLEDTIQYIMSKKEQCDLIITNDQNFVSKDIKLMTSEAFCKENHLAV
ncbi:MAG: hypothetical protein RL113_834 [Pseudomonadota bacterium]|jgi:predicted nucleic acid-binding protein